jgi:N-methylhydantoinase B
MTAAPDPITTAVIGAALTTIVEEMTRALMRAGYSTSIKERMDVSTALMDADGLVLAQAALQPAHLGSLLGIAERVLRDTPKHEIRPGDLFIGNDAYEGGGTHLNDIVFMEPVFAEGQLVAWLSNIAHHADFVDRGHAHIFQEGLRIPPVRLYREGVLNQDLMDLVLLNCQVPHERLNDFRAQRAANRTGMQRFAQLMQKYGWPMIEAAARAILDHTERRTRAGISRIPNGVYEASGLLDSGRCEEILELRVRIEVSDEDILMDFRGNPAQVRAPINLTYMALLVSVYFAVKVLVDPDVPANAGFHRPIRVLADPGTIVCANPPGAVYSRTDTMERLCDLIFTAMAPAVPDAAIAPCTGRGLLTISGIDPRTGRYYVYNEAMGGGAGAHSDQDGESAVQIHVANSRNIPVEVVEFEYPLHVERYELVPDSAGAGRQRGGLSYRRRVRVLDHEARAFVTGNDLRITTWGIDGGHAAPSAQLTLGEGVAPFVLGRGIIGPGQTVEIAPSGGGGWGDPRQRDPALVRQDVRQGKVSPAAARTLYGLDAGA